MKVEFFLHLTDICVLHSPRWTANILHIKAKGLTKEARETLAGSQREVEEILAT